MLRFAEIADAAANVIARAFRMLLLILQAIAALLISLTLLSFWLALAAHQPDMRPTVDSILGFMIRDPAVLAGTVDLLSLTLACAAVLSIGLSLLRRDP